MRRLLLIVLMLTSGCFGDAAIPMPCSTDLPGTKYSIHLHGPDEARYYYQIWTADGDCGWRELGNISFDQPVNSKLENLDNGVFRVTWGNPPNDAFTMIDTKKLLIVIDSNKSNPKNVPFETPRYLRPEYAPLRKPKVDTK